MSTWTPSWSPRHSGLTEARDTSSTITSCSKSTAAHPRRCAVTWHASAHGHEANPAWTYRIEFALISALS